MTPPFEIPPDAPRAEPHAAPVDLNGDLPSEPTPSVQVKDAPENTVQADSTAQRQRGTQEYSSPEPIEAMFALLRDDLAAQQRLLMLTATSVIFLSLLLAYAVKKGALDVSQMP